MRASLRLATLVIGLILTTASVHASDPDKKGTKTHSTKDTKAPAATKDTKTSGGTGTPAVRGTTPPAQGVTPAAQGATTAKLETAAAAAAAAAGASRQGTVTVAAATSAPKEETLEEIVARVKRRLAMESAPKRKVAAPAAPSAAPAPRVTLVWRPYVVWPDELTGAKPETNQPDASHDRVTLQWESDER